MARQRQPRGAPQARPRPGPGPVPRGPESEAWSPILERAKLARLVELLLQPDIVVAVRSQWSSLARRDYDYVSRDRRLPDDELDLVLEGTITGTVEDRPVSIEPGSVLWMPPGARHSLTWPAGLVYYHVHFSIERGPTCFGLAEPFLVLHNVWALEPTFKGLCEEVKMSLPHKELRNKAFFMLLLSGIERFSQIRTPAGRTHVLTQFQQNALTKYVARNVAARPSAAELASIAKLSPNYFSRVFRNTFGMPPRTWLMQQRIQAGVTLLLETQMTVTQVAEKLGYADIYLFSRQFKRVTGRSPRAFRRTYSIG